MSLSVLIIGFLISTSSQNMVSTKALLEEKNNQYINDYFDSSTWKWLITEVVSTESAYHSYDPSLAVDNLGNVHLAWRDETDYAGSGGDRDIFYKRWEASTFLWTTTEVVSTESTVNSVNPSLAVDAAGNVHIAWEDLTDYTGAGTDEDIFYKRWETSTSTWTTTEVVSTNSTVQSYNPSLAVDTSGNVHITWMDATNYAGSGGDRDIFYKYWNASTFLWTTTEVVSTESTEWSDSSSLAIDAAGNVHVAWYDGTDYAGAGTDEDIFYKRWETSTSTWTTTEVVSTESNDISYLPSLAIDAAGNVHIAWYDFTDYAGSGTDKDIFYKRWETSTSTWTTTEVVSTESTGNSISPSLAIETTGNVHIAWEDLTDYTGAGTDADIFYKFWDSSSSTWTTSEVVSTESTGYSYVPSLAVDSVGNIHVAWFDFTDYVGSGTDADIFFKLLSGPPPAPELAFIFPNPTELTTIYLDWDNIPWVTSYHVYRSTSYIWSIENLNPINTISSSEYIDTAPSEGFYYYVIVAANLAGSSFISNCQYVEVRFPSLKVPELAPILPNPTNTSRISLAWDSIDGVTEYHIYRSASYIWSVEGLTPIDIVGSTSYVDTLPAEGYYFYVIVASDGLRNSTHSNCEYVEYKPPQTQESSIATSLILVAFVFMFVVTRIRKKNSKLN